MKRFLLLLALLLLCVYPLVSQPSSASGMSKEELEEQWKELNSDIIISEIYINKLLIEQSKQKERETKLIGQISDLEESLQKQTDELKKASDTQKELHEQLQSLRKELKLLQESLSNLGKEISQLKSELDSLKRDLKLIQNELNAYKTATKIAVPVAVAAIIAFIISLFVD